MATPNKKNEKHWLDPPEWWKKWKPLRWLAVLFIIGGMASGLWSGVRMVLEPSAHPETAAYLAVEKQSVSLMGFNSYSTVEAVTGKLTAANVPWTIKKNHRMPNPDFPPRDLDVVEVAAYEHLGVEGELSLKFFNNRLYEAEFQPGSADAYSEPLRTAMPALKRDRIGKVEYNDGLLRVASNVDLARSAVGQSLHTTPYVIWQDMRLVNQRNHWDESFGSIPYKAAP